MELVSTAEVARRLGVTGRTVARLAGIGALVPAVRAPGIRGALMFDPAEVDRYVAAREAGKVTA